MVPGPPETPYLDRAMISDTFSVLTTGAASPTLPDGIPAPGPGVGEVVAVVSEAEARVDGWAASLVVQLARHWAGVGRLVVLADADWTAASLNVELGPHVGEGLSDLVLYGASPVRVARSPASESFQFIPAGTVVGDPEAAWLHPRWPTLLSAFRDAGTVLILHLPAGAIGAEALAASADRVFRLAKDPGYEGGGEGAVVIRGGEPAESASVSGPEGLSVENSPETQAAPSVPESPPDAPARDVTAVPESTARRSAPGRSRIPVWVPLILLLAIAAAIVVAAWLGILAIPGITPDLGAALPAIPIAGPEHPPLPG